MPARATSEPLAAWCTPRLVDVVHGASRHVVRFVADGERVDALKETSGAAAAREYRLLRALAEEGLPAVEAVGVARTPGGDPETATGRSSDPAPRTIRSPAPTCSPSATGRGRWTGWSTRASCCWRGCSGRASSGATSRSRTRSSGAFLADLVDAETCEQHAELGEPMRAPDVEIARGDVLAGVADLRAGGLLGAEVDPLGAAEAFAARDEELWAELTGEEVLRADQRWRISRRMERLNALGFDVEELAVVRSAEGDELRIRPTRWTTTWSRCCRRSACDGAGGRPARRGTIWYFSTTFCPGHRSARWPGSSSSSPVSSRWGSRWR